MSVNVKVFVPTQVIPTPNGTMYTCPTPAALLDKISVFNSSDTTVATLNIVLERSTEPISANYLVIQKTLQPGESYLCPEITGAALQFDDRLVCGSTDANTLTIRVSGREIT